MMFNAFAAYAFTWTRFIAAVTVEFILIFFTFHIILLFCLNNIPNGSPALLRSDKIQTFEKIAPNVINKARNELYSKYLRPAQSELLLHSEWPKLETIADKQLRERVALLTKVKEQISDNLHDKKLRSS